MKRGWIPLASMLVMAAVGVFFLAWGSTYTVPDLSETRHGFPLVWGHHLLVTIAGPVDRWSVDLAALTLDFAFWLLVVVSVGEVLRRRV